ncbi:epimerase [Bacillus salitolerans]|uniref:Epimerase n=1 Tax=Bacillus salitolerans TaxID=1437434 RepID=A0ABW4LJH7_9BACI
MHKVRDEAIEQWEMTIERKMRSEDCQRIFNLVAESGQTELINELIPQIVDTTLHHQLLTLEQENSIDISVSNDDKKVSLKALSDGLPGELYTEDGWILRFSNK